MAINEIVKLQKGLSEKLFFQKTFDKILRPDKTIHIGIEKLGKISEGNTWFTDEIDYTKDIEGFNRLNDIEQRMFRLNICYQTLMDSGATSVFTIMNQIATNTELKYAYTRIATEEHIHAMSYLNGLQVVFGEKVHETVDMIYDDKFIKNRLNNELDGSREMIKLCIEQGKDDDEAKKALLTVILAIYLLEGVKFPFSFFVTWTINKNNNSAIQGFSRALQLIAHDEMTFHTTLGSTVLNILRKNESEGFKHLFDSGWFDQLAESFTAITVKQEKEWADYLLAEGSVIGFNKSISNEFIDYWANFRLNRIGLGKTETYKPEAVAWFDLYRDINTKNVSLQETEGTAYRKGIVNDLQRLTQ